jgi:hypothetical protein
MRSYPEYTFNSNDKNLTISLIMVYLSIFRTIYIHHKTIIKKTNYERTTNKKTAADTADTADRAAAADAQPSGIWLHRI